MIIWTVFTKPSMGLSITVWREVVFPTNLLNRRAMMGAMPGSMFSNPSLGVNITVYREVVFPTTLLNCRAMVWATPGAVFSNISLGVSITVCMEVAFPADLIPHQGPVRVDQLNQPTSTAQPTIAL